MSAVDQVADGALRAMFAAGEQAGTLRFLYTTTPGSVPQYVFLWRDDPSADWRDGKASAAALLTGAWRG